MTPRSRPVVITSAIRPIQDSDHSDTPTTSAAAASVTIAAAPRRAGESARNNAATRPMSTIGGPAISMSRSARRPASRSISWKGPRP